MISKVLVANRGEIAVRVIRACKELGIKTVAIYSDADKEAMHTQLADEAICVGAGKSKDSYLNEINIISAAVTTKCNAIHPGFGFLSENAEFASICEECNIKFIGPSSETMSIMGNKSRARDIMKSAGVPVVPGSDGVVATYEDAMVEARKIGFPLMIKASAGGGGKGIRLVRKFEELENAYNTAKSEAKNNFNDDSVYMEKFIENPRHIECQILGDSFGNVVHLGERDCSVQRRNQKVIEEAPSYILSAELREKMGDVAVRAAKAVNYVNAGTIEFLVDKNNDFYFMEMNTRIQVEHPITEMITNVDIVKEQLKIASGEEMKLNQDMIKIDGHAIECRINAENPLLNFRPSPGVITDLYLPGGNGVRIDSAVYNGYEVTPYYDSMLAKLIVHGENREEAIKKMISALGEVIVEGIDTNVDYLYGILNDSVFQSGHFDVNFIENFNKNIENIA